MTRRVLRELCGDRKLVAIATLGSGGVSAAVVGRIVYVPTDDSGDRHITVMTDLGAESKQVTTYVTITAITRVEVRS